MSAESGPAVASVHDEQYASLPGGTRLHYATSGSNDKPLLLLLHGFPEAGFALYPLMSRLANEYYCVAPDLRGFDRSSKPVGVSEYRPALIVKDLLELLDHLQRPKAVVFAHDWGGAIAWNLAIANPERVNRLLIVNAPHPARFMEALLSEPDQQKASDYMNALRKPDAEQRLSEDAFRRLDRIFAAPNGQAANWFDAPMRARYHQSWSRPGDQGSHSLSGPLNYYRASPLHPLEAGESIPQPVLDAFSDPTRWQVKVPVSVLWALDDPALLPSLAEGLERYCERLTVTRVAGFGHWVIHEAPVLVEQWVREQLRDDASA